MVLLVPQEPDNPTSRSVDEQVITLEAIQWAEQSYANLTAENSHRSTTIALKELEIDIQAFDPDRARLVAQLMQILNLISTRAWHQMETLLGGDLQHSLFARNQVSYSLLIEEINNLYHHALEAFAEYEHPSCLSVSIGKKIMLLRQKYTQLNPLFLAVLGMQLHYTGKMLMEWMAISQRRIFFFYFKALEDYFCIPRGQVYALLADSSPHSQPLMAVKNLMSLSTVIADQVYQQINHLHPQYPRWAGCFNNSLSLNSSTRDIELFQVYLCWCALEHSLHPIQEELFPVCVMLYPRLQMNWKFVQNTLACLEQELENHLSPENFSIFYPYVQFLHEIFSDQVIENNVKV